MALSIIVASIVTGLITYVLSLSYKFYQNYNHATKRLRIPIVALPLINQNSPPWMILGPMLQSSLARRLPSWLFSRLTLSIYGWEHRERFRVYPALVEPQTRADPTLQGNGKTHALVTSGRLEILSWDSEFAHAMLTRTDDFVQFEIGSLIMGVFGNNVLTTNGDVWRKHRRVVAGAVTERVSKVVFDESVRQASMLMKELCGSSKNGELVTGETLNMFDKLKKVAIHVLYAAGMGDPQDWDQLEDIQAPMGLDCKMTYIDAVKRVNSNAAGTIILPIPMLNNWPTWLPGADNLRLLGQAKQEFPMHTKMKLQQEKKLAAESGETRSNAMSMLIAASEEGIEENGKTGKPLSKRKGPALTDDELVANLFVFTAAGFDSTANTMGYALVLLMRYPKWQEWLCEEVDSIWSTHSDSDSDSDLTQEQSLTYPTTFLQATRTMAVMLETLRLFPAVLHLLKQTKTPQTIRTKSGTYEIPANTSVEVNSIALHADPEVWRNLNASSEEDKEWISMQSKIDGLEDEMRFRPSRWVNEIGSAQTLYKPAPGTYVPWSAGPRVCPGQKMAQVEFVAVFLQLFKHHRIEPARLDVIDKKTGKMRKETTIEINARLDEMMRNSISKLTLEMDVFGVSQDEESVKNGRRGIGVRWVRRN